MKLILISLISFVFVVFIDISPVFAREEILSFNSLIDIKLDGSVVVTETMQVRHEGQQIRRGIHRDLPATQAEVYQVLSVTRNNKVEPFSVEQFAGRYRINTGDDNLLPAPAISTFKITYLAKNILIDEENVDELYWNVIGDEWSFPVSSVSVKVVLPEEAKILQQAGYLGYKNNNQKINAVGNGEFRADKLMPKQELTVAVGFTKDVVYVPKKAERQAKAVIGWALGLLAFFCIWQFYVKTPREYSVGPRFYPPVGLSAAECSFLSNLGSTPTNFLIVHFLQMAHSGFIKITRRPKEGFFGVKDGFLISENQRSTANDEEKFLIQSNICPMEINGCLNTRLINYMNGLEKKISEKLKDKYYSRHILLVGALSSLMFVFGGVFVEPSSLYFLLAFLILIMALNTYQTWGRRFLGLLVMLIMFHMFDSIFQGMLYMLGVYLITILFAHLMFQPTVEGKRVIEHLHGLEIFLKAMHHPENLNMIMIDDEYEEAPVSIEDMEELFPYALVLGLEKAWENKFTKLFGVAALTKLRGNVYYSKVFNSEFVLSITKSGGSVSHG